ncbi:MAG: 30S ribosomal protein S7, partial [Fibrobacteraceae bacterium]|nr:30S ribosomal protein S7 [Fibrobacteraceae bacterium]
MSRRRKALHRSILPDPRYKSTLVTELVGVVLKEGKKTIAERIVYTALDELNKKMEGSESALEKFEKCLENIKPRLEVKTRRVGGANYQVP